MFISTIGMSHTSLTKCFISIFVSPDGKKEDGNTMQPSSSLFIPL